MNRTILSALAASTLLITGCSDRQQSVEMRELNDDNARLSSIVDQISAENAELIKQRDFAREELAKYRDQAEGLSMQLANRATSLDSLIFTGTADGGISLNQDFAFNKGSATINDAGVKAIGKLADLLNSPDYAGTKVIIVGHTDSTPVSRASTKKQFVDNWGLSAMRSAAVIRQLQSAGITAERLQGSFKGQYAPVADNSSREGQSANRRVDIYVSL